MLPACTISAEEEKAAVSEGGRTAERMEEGDPPSLQKKLKKIPGEKDFSSCEMQKEELHS